MKTKIRANDVVLAINKVLYDKRVEAKLSLKDASKALRINKTHLKLIELGYLHVSKKIKPRFISLYKLNKDFFEKNTTYVDPIAIQYDDPKIEKKFRVQIRRPRVRIISSICAILFLAITAVGTYYYTRQSLNPREPWSENYTAFKEYFTTPGNYDEEGIDVTSFDTYCISKDAVEGVDFTYTASLSIPKKDYNASSIVIDWTITYINPTTQGTLLYGDTLLVRALVYNQKKILIFDSKNDAIPGRPKIEAVASFIEPDVFSMKKIVITDGGAINTYLPDTEEYKLFYNTIFDKNGVLDVCANLTSEIIARDEALPTNYRFYEMIDDAQKISAFETFGFRTGFDLILLGSILATLSLSVLILSLIIGRKIKPKRKKEKTFIVHETKYTADAALIYRNIPNDSVFPSVVPEFALRILALAILLLSSLGTIWLTNSIFGTGDISSFSNAVSFNAFISNIFVAGTTLAFFIKLDVFHKKTNRKLLENIITLFIFGLLFYVAECTAYACLSSGSSIYTVLVEILVLFVPGNIIWNLMLYSLIFFFLFTIPKRFAKTPHKVLGWRLCSLIPVLILLFSFLYQTYFKSTGNFSQYVSFIFYTNGALMTFFAIIYLYALFFLQQYVRLKYGDGFTEVYLSSRRYALDKNVVACLVIVFLVLIDIFFHFKIPNNNLNLGNNWIIIILIPFILFYRPHIGVRNGKWDIAYIVLYGAFLVSGPLIAISRILAALDISELVELLA